MYPELLCWLYYLLPLYCFQFSKYNYTYADKK